ncbi:uncharacterized protein DSM5745_06622 [Aspergillus mulundensis]|uniref:NmrA-like domain-containing protein n=1 Tax=Aspergillus mulundensis TaxID=1810919 RepID=A0A3D8RRN3_9EURO|nr:Uncharacterized protein DSM5745_06622 [Aspergillus mulundensis]RDW76630.1 Uncharacterized protein DSM5745_06622 [Aspergillus mulundensis]
MTKAILVALATGKQGSSTIDNLLQQAPDADIEILAVTRSTTSPSAQKLANKSPKIKLVQGNLDQPDQIFENANKVTSAPIWGVYAVLLASFTGHSDIEEKQGHGLIDAALKNNVKHFVYSSVDRGGEASINNPTTVPHFISKHKNEHHLINASKGTDMTWTILRPAAFLDGGLVTGFAGKAWATVWKVAMRDVPLQVIAVSDIGFFAAQAFLKLEEYRGKAVSLAGDQLSFAEMAGVFKSVTGRDVPTTFEFIAHFAMWMVKDMGTMFAWFREEGSKADIQALKKVHPGLKDFRAWLGGESEWRKEV